MVIVCAVSDGYYLPALLSLLYASRLLSSPSPSLFLSLIHTLSAHSHCLCLFLVLHIHVHYISLPDFLSLLYNTSFRQFSFSFVGFLSLAPCYLSFAHKHSLLRRCWHNIYSIKLLRNMDFTGYWCRNKSIYQSTLKHGTTADISSPKFVTPQMCPLCPTS